MVRRLLFAVLSCGLLIVMAMVAMAEERVALVIGNSNYEAVPRLKNPENDAADIAAALRRLGFEVNLQLNLRARETNRALRDFARQSQEADMALLYFAGHGFEIDGQNYLVPTDAQIERAGDAQYEATHVSQLLGAVAGAKTLRLVLLDACRNNPFLTQMADASTRSLGRGLARIEPPGGVLVGYAAKGGTVAYDGEGANSPYAKALLQHLEEPGLEIGKLFRRVRDSVYTDTDGLQEPFTYGSLPARDIFLAAARPRDATEDTMLREFARADITDTVQGWSEFLEAYSGLGLSPPMIRRAHQKRAALRQQSIQPLPSANDSPLIRACDNLAADPDDPERPEDVFGVAIKDIDTNAAQQACVLATSGHPGHLRSVYQLGRVVSAGSDPKIAEPYLRQSANAGYLAAQVALASMILETAPVLPVPTEAIALLETAIESGSAKAPRILADLYLNSFVFLSRNKYQPEELYEIAAERGDVQGMFEIGYRLISKINISDKEREKGQAFLESAARAGNVPAMSLLAKYFLKLDGSASLEKAKKYLGGAALAGDHQSLSQLVREFQNGAHWPKDRKEASKWLKFGAENGHAAMMVEYGYNLEIGRGIISSPQKAAEFYFHALSKGNFHPAWRASSEWGRVTARHLQSRLRTSAKARYRGPIDGQIGGGTRAAMARLCGCKVPRRRIRFADYYK